MNKILAILVLLFFIDTACSEENPSIFLETVANGLISEIQKHEKDLDTNEKLAKDLVRSNLLPAIDTDGFAKRTIGKKAWTNATDSQKKKFVDLFIDLVIGSYAKGLSLYDGQIFKFSDPVLSKSGKSAKVRSSMEQSGNTPIIIDYLLSNKSGSWKIINLTIEGVSMIKSYKSQFSPRLNKLGMDRFLVELESNKAVASE